MKRSPPIGVPVQVHAFLATPGAAKSDTSSLRVKDGKLVEVASGAESTALRLEHVFQQGSTESDVMERSLLPLVKASVEGVNVAVLALGSVASRKSALIFDPIRLQSVTSTVFQALLAHLEAKAASLSGTNDGGDPRRAPGFAFELSVSFVEFFEETMTDLLAPSGGSAKPSVLVIQTSCDAGGKCVANLSEHGPVPTGDAFQRLLETAKRARRGDVGLYGSAGDFSSAILEISLAQRFLLPDASTQELLSRFRIVELPATDRLSRSGAAVRLSEGPLLNKALFALADVLEVAASASSAAKSASSPDSRRVPELGDESTNCPPFDDSHLTTMLRDALGGNCLTLALLSLAPSDFQGSKATLQLGRALAHVETFPVVNSAVIRGLLRRHLLHVASLERAVNTALASDQLQLQLRGSTGPEAPGDRLLAYERKLHELEGKLAQEALATRLVREDKAQLAALLDELKTRYNELFAHELEARKELLACEQEKLALSKAFVQFELESSGRAKELDSDRFEAETKLLRAEQVVLEIQQDDAEKATQLRDLVAKMDALVREKHVLAEELALLQTHSRQLADRLEREAKKNQQLSLELLVAVNQKRKALEDAESAETRIRQLAAQLQDAASKSELPRLENAELTEKLASASAQLESLRRELVLKELEAEKLHLHSRTAQLEQETGVERVSRECEGKLAALASQLQAAHAQAASERKSLELQLERAALDATACRREKEELARAWMAKLQENEELLVANERLAHERDAQLEAFRLKIAFLASASDGGAGANGVGAGRAAGGSGLAALRELLDSYQSHENALRSQLAQQRSATLRLEKRLRACAAVGGVDAISTPRPEASLQDASTLIGGDGGGRDDESAGAADERTRLLLELRDAQSQAALEREKLAASVLARMDLERASQSLSLECAALKLKLQHARDDEQQHVDAIRAMHEALLKQLEELRLRLTQQQQSAANEAKQFAGVLAAHQQQHQHGGATAARDDAGSQVAQLLDDEKRQLEAKLAASTKQWMAVVEQVERRSAELLTKNVMLAQENGDLREHIKVAMTRACHERIN